MMPFFEEEKGAILVADYSANRTDFELGDLENTFPQEIGEPIKLPKDINYPNIEVFNIMLEREYPIAKVLISGSKMPNKLPKAARFFRGTR
jgi:hypothetical protein